MCVCVCVRACVHAWVCCVCVCVCVKHTERDLHFIFIKVILDLQITILRRLCFSTNFIQIKVFALTVSKKKKKKKKCRYTNNSRDHQLSATFSGKYKTVFDFYQPKFCPILRLVFFLHKQRTMPPVWQLYDPLGTPHTGDVARVTLQKQLVILSSLLSFHADTDSSMLLLAEHKKTITKTTTLNSNKQGTVVRHVLRVVHPCNIAGCWALHWIHSCCFFHHTLAFAATMYSFRLWIVKTLHHQNEPIKRLDRLYILLGQHATRPPPPHTKLYLQ